MVQQLYSSMLCNVAASVVYVSAGLQLAGWQLVQNSGVCSYSQMQPHGVEGQAAGCEAGHCVPGKSMRNGVMFCKAGPCWLLQAVQPLLTALL